MLGYLLDNYPTSMNYEFLRLQIQLSQSTPIRFVAIYILARGSSGSSSSSSNDSNTIRWNNAIDFTCYIMGKLMRLRTRVITGKQRRPYLYLFV